MKGIYLTRECPECDGLSGHQCTPIEDNRTSWKTCPFCTSGRQTRPLNIIEDTDINNIITMLLQIPDDACHLNLMRLPIHKSILKQTLKDEGWSIDETNKT